MPTFRKKPVVIEAIKWTGDNFPELDSFAHGAVRIEAALDRGDLVVGQIPMGQPRLTVRTLEGRLNAQVGDWIIRGVKGEFYPCKPEIFDATYEPAEASTS